MATVSLTDPVGHTLADAGIIATNNSNLRAVLNGGIDNANISPTAAISASKITGVATIALVIALGS